MTTKISVEPSSHFILLSIVDHYRSPAGLYKHAHSEEVIGPAKYQRDGKGPYHFYATTTRTVVAMDIADDDPRAIEWLVANGFAAKKEEIEKARAKGTIGAEGD